MHEPLVHAATHLRTQACCYIGMAPSSSKFYPRVAHKKVYYVGMAPSSSNNFYPWAVQKALEGLLPALNFTIAWLTKGLLSWNGPCPSNFCPKLAHKRSAMLEWHLPPLNLASRGSQKVCYLGMTPSSSKL